MSYIDVVFDGPPAHESGRFVEVENEHGASINGGEWIDRGNGLWALRIPHPSVAPAVTLADVAMLCGHGTVLCAPCDFIPPSWKPGHLG